MNSHTVRITIIIMKTSAISRKKQKEGPPGLMDQGKSRDPGRNGKQGFNSAEVGSEEVSVGSLGTGSIF